MLPVLSSLDPSGGVWWMIRESASRRRKWLGPPSYLSPNAPIGAHHGSHSRLVLFLIHHRLTVVFDMDIPFHQFTLPIQYLY